MLTLYENTFHQKHFKTEPEIEGTKVLLISKGILFRRVL